MAEVVTRTVQNEITLDRVKAQGDQVELSDKLPNLPVQDVRGDVYIKQTKNEDGSTKEWIGVRIHFNDYGKTTFLRASLAHVKSGLLRPKNGNANVLVFGPERMGWEDGKPVMG